MTLKSDQKSIKILICIGIVVAAVIAYEPIRHNGFVNYDDDKYITANPEIKSGLCLESLGRAFIEPHFFMWHPLTTITHLINYELFGLHPFGHHFVSVLIHIANALLLFWILINLTKSIWASAFVAAVFALHPLQVESVAWAAELKTVLSGLFWFLTIAVYIWYTRKPGAGRYIFLLGIYGLCIMTKPIVVTLPLILLLLDYWPLERINITTKQAWGLTKLIIEKIPLLFMAGILCVMTVVFQRQAGALATLSRMPLDLRLGNTCVSYMSYIGKLIWPSNLAVFYPLGYSNFPTAKAIICGISLILITWFCIWFGQSRKYLLVGWLWFVGVLLPVSGIVQSGDQAMADRYMYLPMLGLLFIAAWVFKNIIAKKPALKLPAAIIASVILITLIALTRTQVKYWQDSKTLFGHALAITENNTIAENNYGWVLFEDGQYKDAELHFRNALKILPTYYDARYNLGRTDLKQGNLNEAITCFDALLQKRELASLHYDIATALGRQKKYDEAIRHLNRAVEMEPANIEDRKKLGTTLMAAGKMDEAIEQLKLALKISNGDKDIYANLGMAYRRIGKNELAIENLSKAISLKPDNAVALTSLAWVLATKEDITPQDANSAIKDATRACELTNYKEIAPLDTLAIAYASAGIFDEAIKTANKAVSVAKAKNQTELANEIQERIKLFQSGRRFIQK